MAHITNVRKWDDDFAVLIPDEIANELRLVEGTHVTLSLDYDGLGIRRRRSLEKPVDWFDQDSHTENTETDGKRGNEAW